MSTTLVRCHRGSRQWFAQQYLSHSPDDPAGYYAHRHNGYQRFRHQRLVNFLEKHWGATAPAAMLDVGCGEGTLTSLVAGALDCERAVGVDFLPEAIERARAQSRWEFAVETLPKLRYASGEFDLVIASEVLYYLPPKEREAAVNEFHRVLAPRGRLLFTSRLGVNYFQHDEVWNLLGERFGLVAEDAMYNAFYHKLVLPARVVRSLRNSLASDRPPSNQRLAQLIDRRRNWIVRMRASGVLWAADLFGRTILRNALLPGCCEKISRLCLGPVHGTNLTILAEKK